MDGFSLGRVTTLLLLSRGAGYVLALGNSVILARSLGVERLGAYAYAMGIAALFGLLPNMGISTIVTRTIAQNPDAGAGVLPAALRAQALLATGVLIVIPVFAALLPGQPVPLGYVGLAAVQLAVGTISWPYLAVLAGHARYDRVATAELGSALAGTASLLGAAALGGGVVVMLWAQVLAAGVAVVVARWTAIPFLSARGDPTPTRSRSATHSVRAALGLRAPLSAALGLRAVLPVGKAQPVRVGDLFRQAAPFGATAAVQSLYTRLDILLLGQMASTVALGLYNVAYKPANLAVYFGATVAGTLFPLMARARETAVPVSFGRAVRGLGATAPAMALAASGLAGPFLRVLYGSEFTGAAPILVLLAWSAVANWIYAPLGIALQARGRERWWLAALVVGLGVNAGANLWAIPRWGAFGAAGATLASEWILASFGVILISRQLGIRPSLRSVLAVLTSCAAGAGVLWILKASGAMSSTAAALIVYAGFLVLFRMVTFEDVARVAGWLREAAPGWAGSSAAQSATEARRP